MGMTMSISPITTKSPSEAYIIISPPISKPVSILSRGSVISPAPISTKTSDIVTGSTFFEPFCFTALDIAAMPTASSMAPSEMIDMRISSVVPMYIPIIPPMNTIKNKMPAMILPMLCLFGSIISAS